MALVIHYEDIIRPVHIHDYAEIVPLGHATRARVTQIMNLRLLAPDIQEELISLHRLTEGRDSCCLRRLQTIALEKPWRIQREMYRHFVSELVKSEVQPTEMKPGTSADPEGRLVNRVKQSFVIAEKR